MSYIIVFVGAGIGGALRHGVNIVAARLFGPTFPYGTLFVNVSGSFLIAVLVGYFAARSGLSQDVRLFLTTGILGGFTTFSTFSLDTMVLLERSDAVLSAVYVLLSIALSLAAFAGGLAIVRMIITTAG